MRSTAPPPQKPTLKKCRQSVSHSTFCLHVCPVFFQKLKYSQYIDTYHLWERRFQNEELVF